MRSILGAWLVAMGLTSWREIMRTKHGGATIHPPPRPGDLAKTSALFPVLILLYDFFPAEGKYTLPLVAWGFDIAALMTILQGQKYSEGGPWPPAKLDDSILIPKVGGKPVADTTTGGATPAPAPQNPLVGGAP